MENIAGISELQVSRFIHNISKIQFSTRYYSCSKNSFYVHLGKIKRWTKKFKEIFIDKMMNFSFIN